MPTRIGCTYIYIYIYLSLSFIVFALPFSLFPSRNVLTQIHGHTLCWLLSLLPTTVRAFIMAETLQPFISWATRIEFNVYDGFDRLLIAPLSLPVHAGGT